MQRTALPSLAFMLLLCAPLASCALPPSYPSVLSSTVRVRGGARLSASSSALFSMEQVLKRAAGLDPSLDFNLSKVREAPDEELLRLLTLAAVGNFTSSRASSWKQPFSVVLEPDAQGFSVETPGASSAVAVEVMLVVLSLVHFKRWLEEQAA